MASELLDNAFVLVFYRIEYIKGYTHCFIIKNDFYYNMFIIRLISHTCTFYSKMSATKRTREDSDANPSKRVNSDSPFTSSFQPNGSLPVSAGAGAGALEISKLIEKIATNLHKLSKKRTDIDDVNKDYFICCDALKHSVVSSDNELLKMAYEAYENNIFSDNKKFTPCNFNNLMICAMETDNIFAIKYIYEFNILEIDNDILINNFDKLKSFESFTYMLDKCARKPPPHLLTNPFGRGFSDLNEITYTLLYKTIASKNIEFFKHILTKFNDSVQNHIMTPKHSYKLIYLVCYLNLHDHFKLLIETCNISRYITIEDVVLNISVYNRTNFLPQYLAFIDKKNKYECCADRIIKRIIICNNIELLKIVDKNMFKKNESNLSKYFKLAIKNKNDELITTLAKKFYS